MPHEIPPHSIISQALEGVTFYDRLNIQPSDADVLASQVLDAKADREHALVVGAYRKRGRVTTPQHPEQFIANAFADAYGTDGDEPLPYWEAGVTAALAALSAAGYRIIRTDQLEHGDELVQIERAAWDDGLVMNLASSHQPRGEPVWRRVVGNEQETPQ